MLQFDIQYSSGLDDLLQTIKIHDAKEALI